MNFELSVLEVGIICTDLSIAREQEKVRLETLDHDRFPNMGSLLASSINKKTDLINRLDLLVNPRRRNHEQRMVYK